MGLVRLFRGLGFYRVHKDYLLTKPVLPSDSLFPGNLESLGRISGSGIFGGGPHRVVAAPTVRKPDGSGDLDPKKPFQ